MHMRGCQPKKKRGVGAELKYPVGYIFMNF
jgi:hypothetical protein